MLARTHRYRLIHRRQLELDRVFGRNRGTNFDRFGHNRKAGLPDFELIDAVRQALHVQTALIAGRQSISILIRLADDLNGRFHTKTGRIGHFKAQFAALLWPKSGIAKTKRSKQA